MIGDVHGCLDEFQELVEKVAPGEGDLVVCLGDFMDKGPDPAGCVKYARERGFESVAGNHEEKHLRWRRHENRKQSNPFYANPMKPLRESEAEANAKLDAEDILWLKTLPAMIRVGNWVIVHGGLLPGRSLRDQEVDKILRMRWIGIDEESGEYKTIATNYDEPGQPEGSVHWTQVYDGAENVVVGHEAHSLSRPLIVQGKAGGVCYGIDTGCVHGGRLTAMVVTDSEIEFVQVQARRQYMPPHPGCEIPA